MKTYFISYAIYTEDKQWAFGNTMKSFEGKMTGDDLLSLQREIGKGWEKNIVKVLYFCEM